MAAATIPVEPVARELPKPSHSLAASAAESERVINYFDSPEAAARYALDRPSHHGRVLQLLDTALKGEIPVQRALDVGCGTGHSTVALLPYAREVVGLDASSEMLMQATRDPRIRYCKGYAESLPFRNRNFNLVTVSAAYHWFDHERFLAEAARVLSPGGWLVLYKAGTTGRATGQPEFTAWWRDALNARYPKVARNNEPLTSERAAQFGFEQTLCDDMVFQCSHTIEDYVANLLTHSRVIRVVDGGIEPINDVRNWLREQLTPFFTSGRADFTHHARIHVLRCTA